jgi:O-antigen/teichoic acid export membrane protein
MTSLIPNIPRYSIQTHWGEAMLGYFAAMAYLMVAALQPVLALGAVAVPRLAEAHLVDLHQYWRLTARLVVFALVLGGLTVAASAWFGRVALATLYSPEYAEHASALTWLAVAAALGFVASMLSCALMAARRFGSQLLSSAVGRGVCALATGAWVPKFGLVGAAWALTAAEATRLGCFAVLLGVSLRDVRPAAISGLKVDDAVGAA